MLVPYTTLERKNLRTKKRLPKMAQRKRYDANANVIGTAVGCTDLAAFTKADLRALVPLARALAARAEEEISARKPSFPSSLPPQLVLAWLPLREVGPALRASSAWRGAAEPLFQLVAQSRRLRREPDIPWGEVVRRSRKRVFVVRPGARFMDHGSLAERLGVSRLRWVSGLELKPHLRLRVGDVGDLISEVDDDQRAVAFRADRNGAVYIIGRSGVLAGLPGELGTAPLAASQVETLGVAELQKELAARGAVMDTGAEHYTQKGLRNALKREIRNPATDFRRWGIARTYAYDPRAPYYPQAYQSGAEQLGDPGFSSDDDDA